MQGLAPSVSENPPDSSCVKYILSLQIYFGPLSISGPLFRQFPTAGLAGVSSSCRHRRGAAGQRAGTDRRPRRDWRLKAAMVLCFILTDTRAAL
jgi:hypothetical protein